MIRNVHPGPDPDFFLSRIQGSKRTKSTGSRIPDPQQYLLLSKQLAPPTIPLKAYTTIEASSILSLLLSYSLCGRGCAYIS